MATEKLATEVRQEQIARAAIELVAENGLGQLSVSAVARKIGLVPSALYRHFRCKEDVLDAAVRMILEKLQGNVQAVREETGDALEQLEGLLARHVRLIRENRGIPQIIFSQDFYADRPERRRELYDGIRGYLAEVAGILRRGQQDGRVRPDLQPDAAAVMFLGLIQPSAILWHMSDGEFDVTRQARRGWTLFREAIACGASGSRNDLHRKGKGRRR